MKGDRGTSCSSPCQNGGVCTPQALGGAICVCPEGFLGEACEETYVTCTNRGTGVNANGVGGIGSCTETCATGTSSQFCAFPYPFNSANPPPFDTGVCVANFNAGVNCGPAAFVNGVPSASGTEGVCPNPEKRSVLVAVRDTFVLMEATQVPYANLLGGR